MPDAHREQWRGAEPRFGPLRNEQIVRTNFVVPAFDVDHHVLAVVTCFKLRPQLALVDLAAALKRGYSTTTTTPTRS